MAYNVEKSTLSFTTDQYDVYQLGLINDTKAKAFLVDHVTKQQYEAIINIKQKQILCSYPCR